MGFGGGGAGMKQMSQMMSIIMANGAAQNAAKANADAAAAASDLAARKLFAEQQAANAAAVQGKRQLTLFDAVKTSGSGLQNENTNTASSRLFGN